MSSKNFPQNSKFHEIFPGFYQNCLEIFFILSNPESSNLGSLYKGCPKTTAGKLHKAACTLNECWAEQKRMCLGECMPPCVRRSYACIPTDVHVRQMYTDNVHLFVICQEFPLTFARLPPTWQTLANSEQT